MAQYYVGSFSANSNALYHHGIKGQKWGERRFQNEDGSLTEAGRQRYRMSEAGEKARNELHDAWSRMEKSGQHSRIREGDQRFGLDPEQVDKNGKKFKVSGIDDWKFFEWAEGKAIKNANIQETQAALLKAQQKNRRSLGLLGSKQLKKAYDDFTDSQQKFLDEVMSESTKYINQLPKRERDIYRDYVYRRLGLDW